MYWEGIDPWQPQAFGFDYARAFASGVNVVIENIAPYGYGNYNYVPKQTLRLVEAFHRTIDQHTDRMALALSAAEAREIVADGQLAVFLGVESGFDNEGDPDVLRALYHLGLRAVQFSTQTCFNAYADSEAGGPPIWNGINERGRELIALMNELGILIDVTHATPEAQEQIIAASTRPLVASHTTLAAVSGRGMADSTLKLIADAAGMIGIKGVSTDISERYRRWLAANPAQAAQIGPAIEMIEFNSPLARAALDHGEYGMWLDDQMRRFHHAVFKPWADDPDSLDPVPSADDWASHVAHAIEIAGTDHVGIGLDMAGGRSSVPADASGYQDLLAALGRITDAEGVRQIAGENWLRVLDAAVDP